MTEVLLNLLTNLSLLLTDWNNEKLPSEEDFVSKLKAIVISLVKEIPRQKPPEVSADQLTIPPGEEKE